MAFSNLFDNGKSETAALHLITCNSEEPFEYPLAILEWNARAGVSYPEDQTAAVIIQCHVNLPTLRCITNGIVHQVSNQYS